MNITQNELLELEDCLCAGLSEFLYFRSHAIYFPPEMKEKEPIFVREEKLLLTPILWQQDCLGMLRLEGIQPGRIKRLLPVLNKLLSSLLENCLLKRLLHEDLQTGLATEDEFFHFMEKEAAALETSLSHPQLSVRNTPLYRLCKGLIILNWVDGRQIAQEYDNKLYENIFDAIARRLKNILPKDAIGTVLGRYEGRHEFGIIFNTSGRNACHAFARKLIRQLENLEFADPLRDRIFHPNFYGGHAIYPQDMLGEELGLTLREQTVRLRDRARLGVRTALQGKGVANEKIMGFSRILRMGGVILENLGKGRYRINLGLSVNARLGMRFVLLGRQGSYWRPKGQITILELGIMDSVAGIVSMEQTGDLPEKGDRLAMISHVNAWKVNESVDQSPLFPTDLKKPAFCSHAEFMERYQKAANNSTSFMLGISRFTKMDSDIEKQIHAFLIPDTDKSIDLIASYGNNGLIFYLEKVNEEKINSFLQKLAHICENYGAEVQTGIFKWPYLNFIKAESEECALKALEYASLLPPPHIGYFNSMAITIGADRKFGFGDHFGALEDYSIALLADPHNAMARNSMGVCQAALGKYVEAIKNFEIALHDTQDRELLAKINYNIGIACQKINDLATARLHYRKCLKNDDNHIFAWLRLGKLSEEGGARARARRYYICAAARCNADERIFNTVQRHLAQLETAGNKKDQARGRLHDNLVRNPEDAKSLLLLAQLYLDDNVDPALAEMLVRKCLNIQPGPEAWNTLARALEVQGNTNEAERARERGRNYK